MIWLQNVNLQKKLCFSYASSSRVKVRILPSLSLLVYATSFKLIFPFSSNFNLLLFIIDIFKPQKIVSSMCDLMPIKRKFVKQQRSTIHAQT